MRVVKWILGVVLALALVLWLGGYALSPTFKVTRSITINAPPENVFALVASPRSWKQWTVWNRRDPAMAIEYFGPDSGAGAGWSWKSASEGDGKMTFTAAEPGRRLAYDLHFPDFGTTSSGDLTFIAEGAGSRASWSMNGDMGGSPLLRWMALFADSMVGEDFEAGLSNLKALAEQKP